MQGSITKEMHLCLALVTFLVTTASAAHPRVEILKERILANLGMTRPPDMSAVNTSESEMQRMMREYEMRVRKSEEEEERDITPDDVLIYDTIDCIDGSNVLFQPRLSKKFFLISARLVFPDNRTRDISPWVRHFQKSSDDNDFSVACEERDCCWTRLELKVQKRSNMQPECNQQQCCRKFLKISFKKVGWDWIIKPKKFNAFYCKGRCRDEFANFANNHALLQSILKKKGSKVPRPTCVPSKLRSLEVLHYNDKEPPELVTTRHTGMIVKECACT